MIENELLKVFSHGQEFNLTFNENTKRTFSNRTSTPDSIDFETNFKDFLLNVI